MYRTPAEGDLDFAHSAQRTAHNDQALERMARTVPAHDISRVRNDEVVEH